MNYSGLVVSQEESHSHMPSVSREREHWGPCGVFGVCEWRKRPCELLHVMGSIYKLTWQLCDATDVVTIGVTLYIIYASI